MVKVNCKEVKWDRAPNFVNNIQRKVLWRDEKTGAMFVILRAPAGTYLEQKPHNHPKANQFTLILSGEAENPDGSRVSFSEDDYFFRYNPKSARAQSSKTVFRFITGMDQTTGVTKRQKNESIRVII